MTFLMTEQAKQLQGCSGVRAVRVWLCKHVLSSEQQTASMVVLTKLLCSLMPTFISFQCFAYRFVTQKE